MFWVLCLGQQSEQLHKLVSCRQLSAGVAGDWLCAEVQLDKARLACTMQSLVALVLSVRSNWQLSLCADSRTDRY